MPNSGYPKSGSEVRSVLADIFRHQGRSEVVELLENAHAYFGEINYDNWNGGTYTWALRLEVPVSVYAAVDSRLTEIEKEILAKLSYLDRLYPNDPVREVTVSPFTSESSEFRQRIALSDTDVCRLWSAGRFRLFLSHQATYKVEVAQIKDELALYGISAFVAHEAIQPSLEWRPEIELALRSMQGLLALFTPDFHSSFWTDQEIGWAFGRGVLVVPVRLGADPYGFAGKVQGISGTLEQPKALAKAVFETLLNNPQTHGELRRAYSKEFCESRSFNQSNQLSNYITKITDFTDAEKEAIRNACESNSQLANAWNVPETVYRTFGKPQKKPAAQKKSDALPI